MITARTQVKEIVKEAGIDNISGDFLDRLDEKVKQIVSDAVKRAKENGRRTVMGKDVPFCFECSTKHGESLIVKAKLKEAAKGSNVAGDLAEALNCFAHQLLTAACERAEGNQRKTVMAKDL